MKSISILMIIAFICYGSLTVIFLNQDIQSLKAASVWTQNSDADFYNGTSNNLTIVGTGEDAELRLVISEIQNWTRKTHISKPSIRYGHAMSSIFGTDQILLFGGYYYDDLTYTTYFYNDTWVYDSSNDTWTNRMPAKNPSARVFHSMAFIYGTDKILLFGGGIASSNSLNDTWVYDLSNSTWTQKSPENYPSARYVHAIAPIYGDDKIVLFGGQTSPGNYGDNETWVYDLSDDNWTKKTPKNSPQGTGSHAMATIYGTDKVLLFGGVNNTNHTNETWLYDLSDDSWINKTSLKNPDGRGNNAMAAIYGTDKVLLFGGNGWAGYYDDTWIYNMNNNTWMDKTPINSINKPSPRCYHAMATVQGTNNVILFGGVYNAYLNDTWIYNYNLSTANGSFISNLHNTGTNSTFIKINWNISTSINTSIKFRIRTAANESTLLSKVFVGPDGSPFTYYTFSPSNIWSGHNGDTWLQVKIYLNTTNKNETPSLEDITISYNRWPNTTLISPADDNVTINNKPAFVWNFTDLDSDYQTAFQVLIDDNRDFKSVDYDSDEQISVDQTWQFPDGTSYTGLPDGTWYWIVRTKDDDGDWGLHSYSWKIIIDTKTPNSTLNLPINNGIYYSLDSISGTAFDPPNGSGLNKVEITIKRLSDDNYWYGSGWNSQETWLLVNGTTNWSYNSSTVTWTSGTQYRVRSRATDHATNVEIPNISIIFTIDMDRPLSVIENPSDNIYLINLDIISGSSIDISGSGIEKVEITIERTIDNMYWSGSSWIGFEKWLMTSGTIEWSYDTSIIPWESGTQYRIRSRATDNVFNIEIPSNGNIFTIDLDKPSSTIDSPKNNAWLNNLDTISGTAIDINGSGIDIVEIIIMRGGDDNYWNGIDWNKAETWLMATGTNNWSYDTGNVQWETDIQYIIRSRATDNVTNIEDPGIGIGFFYDNQPPELLILINNDEMYTKSVFVSLSLTSNDSGSGVSQMAFSTDGDDWSDWEIFSITKTFELPAGDGEKFVYFRVQDYADNIADPVLDAIILDSTPPEERSIIINENAAYTNSKLVDLTLEATDSLSGINNIAFSTDLKTWSTWEPFIHNKSMNLTFGDGKKTIYFKVQDHAGNIGMASDTIIFDTTPPHSLYILVNKSSPDTDSQLIALDLYAIDDTSGVSEMSFSTDGSTWTSWEPFNHEKSLTLPPNDGEKIIYFRVKDNAGNIAEPVLTSLPSTESQKPDNSPFSMALWLIVIVAIIIILIVVIFIIKRKKRSKQELPQADTITIQPTQAPQMAKTEAEALDTSTPSIPQLPVTTGQKISAASTESAPGAPKLAETIPTSQTPTPKLATPAQQQPQLPPATVQPKPTIPTIPTITPIPDNTQLTPPPEPKTEPLTIQGPDKQQAIETGIKEMEVDDG